MMERARWSAGGEGCGVWHALPAALWGVALVACAANAALLPAPFPAPGSAATRTPPVARPALPLGPAVLAPPVRGTRGFVRLTDRAWAFVAADERSSNGALFVGDDSALAVDPGLTPDLAASFLAGAAELTDKPLRFVVLTHWHPDHALGALCLDPAALQGAQLVCHPATRVALAENAARLRDDFAARAAARGDEAERRAFQGRALHLPEQLIDERAVFELGAHEVVVFHPGAAHTPGDLVVWSEPEGVLATGDLFMQGSCPSMGEGSVLVWLDALQRLQDMGPRHVIPGHFEPGGPGDLRHFADYLAMQLEHARSDEPVSATLAALEHSEFAGFQQFPQYGATFEGNAAAVRWELAALPPERGEARGFTTLAVLDVGAAPHQIAFSADGRRAYVAAAGSDRISIVSTDKLAVVDTREVPGTPLGVAELPGGDLLVSAFRGDHLLRLPAGGGPPVASLTTGAGSSLFTGPLPDGRYLVSTEEANALWVVDGTSSRLERSYPTGARPFPPAATADGRLAFVPDYDDGTLSVIDLWNQRVAASVPLGEHPSGGAVVERLHADLVAVRGEDALAFVNTASFELERRLQAGIGEGPFSVVLNPEQTLAFVNNTASHDVSVLALTGEGAPRVIARPAVGEIPITLAVSPDGRTLWVGCEGSDELWVLSIPPALANSPDEPPPPDPGHPTEVLVLGMIHGQHRTSTRWGLEQVEATLRTIDPDVVCPEIPPERWGRVWRDYSERGVIEDPRVRRFPEYTDVLLPLKVQLGFEVEPCAAWTQQMSDLREARMEQFDSDPDLSEQHAAYEVAEAAVQAELEADPIVEDDPRVIHSPAYDERTRRELGPYDEYLNDWIGPGGWTHINQAHWDLIAAAIAKHPGERVLITFGAGHKYWILDQLRQLKGVRVLDVGPYLP